MLSGLLLPLNACVSFEAKEAFNKANNIMLTGNYCSALKEFNRASSISPDLLKEEAFILNTSRAKKECSAVLYKEGIALADKGNLQGTLDKFKAAVELDPSNVDAQEGLAIAVASKTENDRKAEEHYKTGLELFTAKDWQKAFSEFDRSLTLNPKHLLSRNKKAEADRELKKTAELYQNAVKEFERKQWANAIEKLNIVLAASPFHSEAPAKIKEAQEELQAAVNSYEKGMLSLNRNDTAGAEKSLKDALSHNPYHAKAKESLASIFYKKALLLESKGLSGNALAEFIKTSRLLPNYKETNEKINILTDAVKQRITYKIALLPFKDLSKNEAAAESAYERVLKNFSSRQKESNLRIFDREELNKILSEQKLSMSGLIDSESAVSAGRLKGVNALVTGKLLSVKVTTDVSAEPKTKEYKSGTRQKRNPAYDQAVNNVNEWQKTVESSKKNASKNNWGYLAAVTGLSTAQTTLKNTPKFIDDPVYSKWNYKVITHKKKALVKISCRLLDTETGMVLYNDIVDEEFSVKSSTVENPYPDIGVHAKALDIASDDELQDKAISVATQKTTDRLFESLSKAGYKFYAAAEKAKAQGNITDAVENYMNFLFSIPEASQGYKEEREQTKRILEL